MNLQLADKINLDSIRKVLTAKNYKFFTGVNDINIIGVRAENSQANKFDDIIVVIYNKGGRFVVHKYAATTDPGKHWLFNPMNINGCAIMVPGQYRNAYKIGRHNSYKALQQIRPIDFVRDNNKDLKLDFDLYRLGKGKIYKAVIGANIHRAHEKLTVFSIDKYSAACQVFQHNTDFQQFLSICDLQYETYKDKWSNADEFTYTLIEEQDLN